MSFWVWSVTDYASYTFILEATVRWLTDKPGS